MGLLLLLERNESGMGPVIPVRDNYTELVVRGLEAGAVIVTSATDSGLRSEACCDGRFPCVVPRGEKVRAQFIGIGRRVTVELEASR